MISLDSILDFLQVQGVSFVYWQHCHTFEDDLEIMEDGLKSWMMTKIPKPNLSLQIMDRIIWILFRQPGNQVRWPGNL